MWPLRDVSLTEFVTITKHEASSCRTNYICIIILDISGLVNNIIPR
jgi:hypothetical protein